MHKNGGKFWNSKNHMKFHIIREKIGISRLGPVSTHLLINFEKILCSKETSHQILKPYDMGIVTTKTVFHVKHRADV